MIARPTGQIHNPRYSEANIEEQGVQDKPNLHIEEKGVARTLMVTECVTPVRPWVRSQALKINNEGKDDDDESFMEAKEICCICSGTV